jgi:hypothetical protein
LLNDRWQRLQCPTIRPNEVNFLPRPCRTRVPKIAKHRSFRKSDESDHRARDQSVEIAHWSDYQPDSQETVSQFEFPIGTGARDSVNRRFKAAPVDSGVGNVVTASCDGLSRCDPHHSLELGSPPRTAMNGCRWFPAPSARTTNMRAFIYDSKAIGGALRKKRIGDGGSPQSPSPSRRRRQSELPDRMFDRSYWGTP